MSCGCVAAIRELPRAIRISDIGRHVLPYDRRLQTGRALKDVSGVGRTKE